MDVENIGRFLFNLRKENNLTQKDIAKLCSVSAQAVSKWERGESVPDIELLERLSVLYKVSINEIVNGEKEDIYIDLDKRRSIINLTASILVFMAYFFNFVHNNINSSYYYWDIQSTIKGYDLIFNGVGGFVVVIAWFVFVILVSHLIIRIYLLTKIIEYTSFLHKYLMRSMILIVFISVVSLFTPGYYAFPQLIILMAILIQISNSYKMDFKKSDETIMMEDYKINYKSDDIDLKLLINKKHSNSNLIKYSRIGVRIGIVIYYVIALSMLMLLIGLFIDSHTTAFSYGMMTYTTTIAFVLATFIFEKSKYIGSFYTRKALIQIGIAFLAVPVFIAIINGVATVGEVSPAYFIMIICIVLEITLTSLLLFFVAYKIKQ